MLTSPPPNENPQTRKTCLSGLLSLTLQKAAEITGISVATLRRHHHAERLVFIKIGGRTLVDARSLEALLFGSCSHLVSQPAAKLRLPAASKASSSAAA